jgi:hypothetical protein
VKLAGVRERRLSAGAKLAGGVAVMPRAQMAILATASQVLRILALVRAAQGEFHALRTEAVKMAQTLHLHHAAPAPPTTAL